MKLLELKVEHLRGVPDGTHSFVDTTRKPHDRVLLANDPQAALLQTIAALMEAMRSPTPPPHELAWWAGRRGSVEARLRARWALTEGEAARAGLLGLTAASEWRFGPGDDYPRELPIDGRLPAEGRAGLARYVLLDPHSISTWMEVDPLADLLAGVARQDVLATQVAWREGVGTLGCRTPDTFAALTQTLASLFPALRLERVSGFRHDTAVACFRDGVEVELEELPELERGAIYIAATLALTAVRDGVVLVDRPDRHVAVDARDRWHLWLAGMAGTNQLIVATEAIGEPSVMSITEPPPLSRQRAAGQIASTVPPPNGPEAPSSAFPGTALSAPRIEPEASRSRDAHPWLDPERMRDICARARLLVADVPQEPAQGYRLIAVRDRGLSWVDIRVGGDGYAVLGSHRRCDLVLPDDDAVWLRHLVVVAVRRDDGGLGARLIDLNTNVPFFVDDDTPRLRAFARGRFAMRLGQHVVCGFPVIFLDAARGRAANDEAVQAVPVVEPAPTGRPLRPFLSKSRAATRLILKRGNLGASIEVPADTLDAGIVLGRAYNCFDAGLRRVLCDESISGAQVLLLRTGLALCAYDLCSTNGTRLAGRRVRRHIITSTEPTLELGNATLKIKAEGEAG